jgi:hypothetical protein
MLSTLPDHKSEDNMYTLTDNDRNDVVIAIDT